jgi:hypothetical protein
VEERSVEREIESSASDSIVAVEAMRDRERERGWEMV